MQCTPKHLALQIFTNRSQAERKEEKGMKEKRKRRKEGALGGREGGEGRKGKKIGLLKSVLIPRCLEAPHGCVLHTVPETNSGRKSCQDYFPTYVVYAKLC